MKKKVFGAIVIVLLLLIIGFIWYKSPVNFMALDPNDVAEITIFDGTSGETVNICGEEEIKHIINNLNSVKVERGSLSQGKKGYRFRFTIHLEEYAETIGWTSFIINSNDTIRRDPFFYNVTSGNIDLEYIQSLFDEDLEGDLADSDMETSELLSEYPSREQYDTMVEKIEGGDFTCLDIPDSYAEKYAYTFDTREWIASDIDKDGYEELILQEITPIYGSVDKYRIVAVFTYRPTGMHCALMDVNDSTEYYFLGDNGNLIYSIEDYLADGNFGEYFYCAINEEGEPKKSYRLNVAYMNEAGETFYVRQRSLIGKKRI